MHPHDTCAHVLGSGSALEEGVTYSQVSAGHYHTVLLRSDGRAVACGRNDEGQCNIPGLRTWRETLTLSQATARKYVPQAFRVGIRVTTEAQVRLNQKSAPMPLEADLLALLDANDVGQVGRTHICALMRIGAVPSNVKKEG